MHQATQDALIDAQCSTSNSQLWRIRVGTFMIMQKFISQQMQSIRWRGDAMGCPCQNCDNQTLPGVVKSVFLCRVVIDTHSDST